MTQLLQRPVHTLNYCPAGAQQQSRTPRRCNRVRCTAQTSSNAEPTTHISRRDALALSLSAGLLLHRTGAEAASESLPSTLGTDINASTPDEDVYVAVEFSLTLPPGFRETAVIPPKPAAPQAGFGTFERQIGPAPVSPVKAKFVSDDGAQLSVVVRPAAEIRPTFLQVTDISQYGDVAAAQSVLVPPGSRVLDKSTAKIQRDPRNTGTVAGVVKVPPITIYRYEFVTGSGVHAVMAAAASKGQVYVAGGTCPGAQWQAVAPALRQAVQSFKLI